jgi:hypothetical protein
MTNRKQSNMNIINMLQLVFNVSHRRRKALFRILDDIQDFEKISEKMLHSTQVHNFCRRKANPIINFGWKEE